MPRSEARLQFDMWRRGLDRLSPHAKLVYCVLLTEPTVTQAGVGAWRPSRWAVNASLTLEELQVALDELAADDPLTAQIVIDEDTEEILIRTIIRNDGVADMPYVLKGAITAALTVSSRLIRWVLAHELRKLPPKRPDGVSRSGKPVVYPDPHAAADILDPPGSPDPFERVSGPSRDPLETLHGGGYGGGSGSGSSSCSRDGRLRAPGSAPAPAREGASEPGATNGQRRPARERVPPEFPGKAITGDRAAQALRLVEAYAKTCTRRPTAELLTELGVEVGKLLAESWPETDVAAALTAWGAKGLGPRLLASVANEVVNSAKTDKGARNVYEIPDDQLTEADIEEILGPVAHDPDLPRSSPEDVKTRAALAAWREREFPRFQAKRRERAIALRRERLARAVARGPE
jgi:hypothetical protein